MSQDLEIIRDPKVFNNSKTVTERITPFQLHNDTGFDGYRNANTQIYRNYNSYASEVNDLTSLINKAAEVCKDPEIALGKVYKCAEDLLGNRYILFKTISDENTVKDKYDALGNLFVFDVNGEVVETLGSVEVDSLSLRDIVVSKNNILLVTDTTVYMASSSEFEFIQETVSSHFNYVVDKNGDIILFYDEIVGDFNLYRYNGKNLKRLSTENLSQLVTTSVVNIKNGRYEVIITNSDVVTREDQTIQFHEYDIREGVWDGVEIPNFPYEILGGYSKDNIWFVYHEQLTYPNYVGGLKIKVSPKADTVTTTETTTQTSDIYINYGESPNDSVIKNIEFFGDFSSLPGIKFRGIERTADGRLVLAPYDADNITYINPIDDTVDINISTNPMSTTGNRKWVDMITASDGLTYFSPNYATGALVLDSSTNPPTYNVIGSTWQTRSVVEVNKVLYFIRYTGPNSLVRYDLESETFLSGISWTMDRTGPFYESYSSWGGITSYIDRHWGAAAAPNGKIFVTPWGSDRVLIIDTNTNTAYQGVDTLTGNRVLPKDGDPFALDWEFNEKYVGAVYSPINKCVYAMPRRANAILKTNTITERSVEIPLPDVLLDNVGGISGSETKSFTTVEGPKGLIFSSLWKKKYIFWIDPRDDSIGYMNAEHLIPKMGDDISALYYTYAKAVGNSIYFAPGFADKCMKITV